ncbi:hypothetical protein FRC11_010754 [Ceratobasidium sp. 423]|nr:hypothetical protein FRC11_010754 [Ceratobasidium sp. 423]
MTIPLANPSFEPSTMAQWINGIWFISLGLSLSAALIAMLGKEWLTAYLSFRPRPAHKHALLRQGRLEGLQDWWALHIIALLPSILHLSLLLFAIGLVLYLLSLNAGIAIVFALGVGVTLVFDISTIVLGAIFPNCPFVTEATNYLKKLLDACRSCGWRERTQDAETQAPEDALKDIQALLWLANHSRDPSIVDCSYQAMAGLRHLLDSRLWTVLATVPATGPTSPTDRMTAAQTTLPTQLDKDTTSNELLSTVVKRFVSLLDGTLELASPEALVDRHINAIIAIRTSIIPNYSITPVINWLQLLKLIEGIGYSSIILGSINPSSFANLLIAEMHVINLALRDLEDHTQRPSQDHIQLMLTSVAGGLTTSEGDAPIITLRKCTNRWLQLVSLVLTHHSGGKILLDSSLLMKLLGSMRDAVQPMLLRSPERGSSSDVDMSAPIEFVTPFAYRIPVTYHSDDLMMGLLDSIVGVLLMPLDTSDDLQLQINRNAVAAYSSLAPVVLRRILGGDAEPDTQFIALQDSKPSSLEECMYIAVCCMMLMLDCLLKDRYRQHVLRLEGRLLSMVGAALALVSGCVVKDRRSTSRDTGALDALREHLHILNELLDDHIYHSSVWDIIAHILSLAADTDIDSNELELHSVDSAELYQAILKVLEAVIWALEYQNPISAEDKSVPGFFTGVAALMAWIRDSDSLRLITEHPTFERLLSVLRDTNSKLTHSSSISSTAERIQEVIKKLAEMKNTPSAGKSPGRDLVTNLPEQTGPSTKPAEQAETTGGSVLRATQTVADVEHIDEPPLDVNAGDMVENGGGG